MAYRLIRDSILDSERVQTLPIEARWLYVSLLLTADDVGLLEIAPYAISRRAGIDPGHFQSLLGLLTDTDLVRLYSVGTKTYGFLPRYGQRLKIQRSKQPLPPLSLLVDDDDAIRKIKHLALIRAPDSGGLAPPAGLEPEPEPEARDKGLSHDPTGHAPPQLFAAEIPAPGSKGKKRKPEIPPCPHDRIVEIYHRRLPMLPAVRLMSEARRGRLRRLWAWAMTSSTSDGRRRATTLEEGVAWFETYLERASQNGFITGETARSSGHEGWRADLDFLCTERGMRQVIEKTQVAA